MFHIITAVLKGISLVRQFWCWGVWVPGYFWCCVFVLSEYYV